MTSTPVLEDVVLEARNVTKNYGGTRALKGVTFRIRPGTVTTLFGENGAGKSTLMKILSGVEQPTSGEVFVDGQSVDFDSTTDAAELGISRSEERRVGKEWRFRGGQRNEKIIRRIRVTEIT